MQNDNTKPRAQQPIDMPDMYPLSPDLLGFLAKLESAHAELPDLTNTPSPEDSYTKTPREPRTPRYRDRSESKKVMVTLPAEIAGAFEELCDADRRKVCNGLAFLARQAVRMGTLFVQDAARKA